MPELKETDLIEDIGKHLDRIFMERRIARDLEFDVEKIDAFIVEEGARLKQHYEDISVHDMMEQMLNEVISFFVE